MPKKQKISLSRLESFLKAQCDRLRTSMDAAEYKNYIIALLFLKRINDQFEIDRIALKELLRKQYPDIEKDWDEKYGDREVKLVFIGRNMDKEAIISSLDKCLDE